MKFLKFLLKYGKTVVILSALFGALAGYANAMLIRLINDSLEVLQSGENPSYTTFAIYALTALFAGILSQVLLIRLSQNVTYNLRLNMCHQILNMPLREIERTGSSRLVATFTQDIPPITSALLQIPTFFTSSAVILAISVDLVMRSPVVFGVLALFLVTTISSYLLPERRAVRYIEKTRNSWDNMMGEFEAMIKGSKELKLHYLRRQDFYHRLIKNSADEVRRYGLAQRVIYAILDNWAELLYFLFVAILLFILPTFKDIELTVITHFVIAVLYMANPVSQLMQIIPIFRSADVAFEKTKRAGLTLLAAQPDQQIAEDPEFIKALEQRKPFQSVELRDVIHTYYREREESHFQLGPINLKIDAGELIFLIGGNGSGKTTLAKLFTGLYPCEKGQLLLNGETVTDANRAAYNERFTAIYSDFHVFEQFLGLRGDALDEKGKFFLEKLHLDHKVRIEDGSLTTTSLSTGQRKRLALLTAYLEDREIYLFDEWAADQDPEFKDVFYRNLLPELKQKGKTILVISHDDRYFDIADRIVKLTDGQITVTNASETTV